MALGGAGTEGRVAVRDLVKRFGPVAAVDGVSLDVAAGEFVALLGPSGSGKTTILMAIAGFEFPTSGRVEIGGEDVTWAPPNKRNLGMVFQRYTLFPHMSVVENIAFPLKMRGIGRAEREAKAQAALATVRLEGYGARRPSQLSGGQQQRVALARAIVYRPRVLLMDEPLSALDKNLREEMQLEIKHLQQRIGVTVVFVTHDQTEAMTMADRVAVLDRGRLQQVGAPRDLYEAPATPFVAGFIGETNFLPGRAKAAAVAGAPVAVALDGGGEAVATAVGAVPAGVAVRVAVRPERVALSPPSADTLPGTIAEAIYAGVATTCIADIGGDRRLRARIAAGTGLVQWEPGARVGVGWRAEDARAFAAAP
ncbi:MAG: ABC transporter ATP-binding protein [Alphaproteobacteria bacterium]|nr:ABC transporter ATP-binding protein [Alphaproteobacteria bacterium]